MTHLDTPCILYQTVSWSCWFVHYGDSCFLQQPLFSSRESPLYSEQYRFASIHAKALTGHLLGHRTLWAPHSVSLWVTALLKTEQSSTSNRPMSLNGPLSLPLSQPSTPPELTSAACQTQLPFGFAHAVPFSQHIFLQTPIVIMPLPPRGSAQTRFCHEGAPFLPSTR